MPRTKYNVIIDRNFYTNESCGSIINVEMLPKTHYFQNMKNKQFEINNLIHSFM